MSSQNKAFRTTESQASEVAPRVTIEGETFPSAPQCIEYPDIGIPEPGNFAEVAPGILWLRIPMPMDLNHINLWLLEDHDGWTLIDSGLGADMCRSTWEILEAKVFAKRPLSRIFVTHFHPDHVGLASWLQQRHRCKAWMSKRGFDVVQNFLREPSADEIRLAENFMCSHGYTDTTALSKFFSGKMYRSSVSGAPDIERHPNDVDEIEINGAPWRLYETNGHAEGHQCLHESTRRILISGDQVLPTISSNVSYSPRGTDSNPLASYLESLERLAQLDAHTLVLPSHGRPFYGLKARAQDLITHHREHLAAMSAACAEPRTAFELVPVLFKRRLIGAHWMFAMGETIAHAEYLAQEKKLIRQVDASGTIRYQLLRDT